LTAAIAPAALASWDFSCPDWRERLATGRALVSAVPLDQAEAQRARRAFDMLRLPDVPGAPSLAEAGGDWFRDIVGALFGSLDRASGVRRVGNVVVVVPKKNSKTTNSAGLMLTALLLNQRPRSRFGLFAPTQEISDTAFAAATGMINLDADLKKLLHVRDHIKTITHRVTGAHLKVTTFDPQVATGGLYAGWLLDELHLMAAKPYAARVIGQLRGARAAIPESFGVIITTQSEDPPAGVFKDELNYARAVRDGRQRGGALLPVLYEFPEEVQTDPSQPWLDPTTWGRVNPNLGRSVSIEILREQFDQACAIGEHEKRRWLSQHLNVEIGVATHDGRWKGVDHWLAAAEPLTLESVLAGCEGATIGVDGGGLDDLLGLCVLGRERGSKRWLAWFRAWADRGVLELRKEIASRLTDFEKEGDLAFVDIGREAGLNEDVDGVADIVETVWRAGLLPEKHGIGLDPVGVAAITDAIAARGVPPDLMVGVPQGYRLSGCIQGAARKLKDGTLRVARQPLAAWCAGNARTELRGNAVLITKQASGVAKIDPLLALFNAFDLMARNPEAGAAGRAADYWSALARSA